MDAEALKEFYADGPVEIHAPPGRGGRSWIKGAAVAAGMGASVVAGPAEAAEGKDFTTEEIRQTITEMYPDRVVMNLTLADENGVPYTPEQLTEQGSKTIDLDSEVGDNLRKAAPQMANARGSLAADGWGSAAIIADAETGEVKGCIAVTDQIPDNRMVTEVTAGLSGDGYFDLQGQRGVGYPQELDKTTYHRDVQLHEFYGHCFDTDERLEGIVKPGGASAEETYPRYQAELRADTARTIMYGRIYGYDQETAVHFEHLADARAMSAYNSQHYMMPAYYTVDGIEAGHEFVRERSALPETDPDHINNMSLKDLVEETHRISDEVMMSEEQYAEFYQLTGQFKQATSDEHFRSRMHAFGQDVQNGKVDLTEYSPRALETLVRADEGYHDTLDMPRGGMAELTSSLNMAQDGDAYARALESGDGLVGLPIEKKSMGADYSRALAGLDDATLADRYIQTSSRLDNLAEIDSPGPGLAREHDSLELSRRMMAAEILKREPEAESWLKGASHNLISEEAKAFPDVLRSPVVTAQVGSLIRSGGAER